MENLTPETQQIEAPNPRKFSFDQAVLLFVGLLFFWFSLNFFPNFSGDLINVKSATHNFLVFESSFIAGMLLVISAFSNRLASQFRIALLASLGVIIITLGSNLLFGLLLAGAMAFASPYSSPNPLVLLASLLGIPALFLGSLFFSARAVWRRGKEAPTTLVKMMVSFVGVLVLAVVFYAGVIAYIHKSTTLTLTIKPLPAVSVDSTPNISGTVLGTADFCVVLVQNSIDVSRPVKEWISLGVAWSKCTYKKQIPVFEGKWSTFIWDENTKAPILKPGSYHLVAYNLASLEILANIPVEVLGPNTTPLRQ